MNASIFNRIEKERAIADLITLQTYWALRSPNTALPEISDNLYEISVSQDWPVTDIPKRVSLLRAELQEMTQRGQLQCSAISSA